MYYISCIRHSNEYFVVFKLSICILSDNGKRGFYVVDITIFDRKLLTSLQLEQTLATIFPESKSRKKHSSMFYAVGMNNFPNYYVRDNIVIAHSL